MSFNITTGLLGANDVQQSAAGTTFNRTRNVNGVSTTAPITPFNASNFPVLAAATAAVLAAVGVAPATSYMGPALEAMAKVWRDEHDARAYGTVSAGASSVTAIQAAIDAAYAVGAGAVRLPPGNIRCDTLITLKSGVVLVGHEAGTHLDFSNAGAIGSCIKGSGTIAETSVAFSANIVKGDTTITFPSAPTGVAAGSILVIYDSQVSLFNAARTYYRKGEWCKVKGVSGGTVTLDAPVFDSYTTGGTRKVYVVTPIVTGLRNLRATFKAGLTGVEIEFGHRCILSGLELSGSDTSCLTLDRCFETLAEKVNAFDVSANITANYGITLGNCQRMIVTGCRLDTTRHGLAIGGGDYDGAVPNRDILVTSSFINGHSDSICGADIHGNSEYVTYRGNEIPAGISFGGDNITIADNGIRTSSGTSKSGLYASELLGPNIFIHGNRFTATGALTGGNSAAINFSKNSAAWQYASRSGTLSIRGNAFDMHSYDGVAVYIRNGHANDMLAATATIDLDVAGNRVAGTVASGDRYGIEIVGQPTGTADKGFKTVRVSQNHLANATLRVEAPGARTTIIADNDILSAAVQGIYYAAGANYHGTYQDDEELVLVENNRVPRPNSTGIRLEGVATTRSFAIVRGNTSVSACQGGNTGTVALDNTLYLSTWTRAVVERNLVGEMPNDGVGTMNYAMGFNAITDLYKHNNHVIGAVTAEYTNAVTNTILPYVDAINNQSNIAGTKEWDGVHTFSAGWLAGASGVSVPAHAFRDAGAGDSTNIVRARVGNSGTDEGSVDTYFWNAAAAGAPAGGILFLPRNNADTSNFQGGGLTWAKNGGSDTADLDLLTGSARFYQEGGTGHTGIGTNAPNKTLDVNGDVQLKTAGNGLYIAEGANATSGAATLVAGAVTVSTTKVTANSRIQLTGNVDGGTPGWLRVSARTPGTNFTITSSSGADTSTVAWVIVEPGA